MSCHGDEKSEGVRQYRDMQCSRQKEMVGQQGGEGDSNEACIQSTVHMAGSRRTWTRGYYEYDEWI